MKKLFVLATAGLAASLVQAAPYLPEQIQLRVTVEPHLDLGIGGSTMYNPRFFDGNIYANQINTPCFGRYPSGSGASSALVNNTVVANGEHRMVAPFRGSNRSIYMLGSSSGAGPTTTFSRYDFDGSNRIDTPAPDSQCAEGWDWVDDDTIIFADYLGGNRKRLYLADVVAEPFSVTKNTAWNADGYVTSAITTRIRNVRVGDVYSGYAYYGDNGVIDNPKVYALNLATGMETAVTYWHGTLKGPSTVPPSFTGSFGLWTVVERGGYLFLHSSDDGIQVYTMTGAATAGLLYATYTKEQLDLVSGPVGTSAYYGFDVDTDGQRLLLGGVAGAVFEVGPPLVGIGKSGTDMMVTWAASVTNVVVQSSTNLTTGFTDIDPRPNIFIQGNLNTATIAAPQPDKMFFRLRRP